MIKESTDELLLRIAELENRLTESEQLIDAVRAGEVDAFAISNNNQSAVYTLQSGDYAYRVLVEEFAEGAVNVTEEGIIVYTNSYFCELVGLPYEEVIGSFFSNLIHPDSESEFERCFREALGGKCKGEINLFENGKLIPVYISLTSLQPNLPTVGIVVSDLTTAKKNEAVILQYQKELEIKNLELLQSNADLASFAYLASHDLQEPLRKIQIFCDRILEQEADHFSPGSKDYFHRVVAASGRMQHLIIALLNYSRISTSKIVLTEISLTRIVEDVKADLHELIQEHGAIVELLPLPALRVVALQFNQLFSNLIINAIKYRKAGTKPVIKISARIVTTAEIPEEGPFKDDHYWQIEVRDNGIGFEQIYAERIFELFQRLHGKSEYEGTGIGLAICKKIVQNHHGFINATGEPDMGSVFNIYLPLNLT